MGDEYQIIEQMVQNKDVNLRGFWYDYYDN